MIYIHKLGELGIKSAELETVALLREIKRKTQFPLTKEQLEQQLAESFVFVNEKEAIEAGISQVMPTADKISAVMARNNPLYEAINLQRGVSILQEMEKPLQKQLVYVLTLLSFQQTMLAELAILFNSLPKLRDKAEKERANEQLNDVFRIILRNEDMHFEYSEIIHEAQVSHIGGLVESMAKGFFFHYTLEEELKKVGFDTIRMRIPREALEEYEEIYRNVTVVKKSIDQAYAINMRMIGMALVLYTYVKMLTTKEIM